MNLLASQSFRLLAASLCLLVPVLHAARPGQPSTRATVVAAAPPVIISPEEAEAVVNQSFNYQIVLANFQTGMFSAVDLPDGLSLDAASGVISGAPTRIGVFTATLFVSNENGRDTATLTLSVLPAAAPVIRSAGNVTAIKGASLTYQIVADNVPTSYGADGLPEGLVLNAETGLISGVPTTSALSEVTLSAVNIRGAGTLVLKLSVVPSLPTVTLKADFPAANPVRGQQGRFTIAREGGDPTQPLLVVVTIKGSAKNGVDYPTLSFAQTIKKNKKVRRVKINAFPPPAGVTPGKKTVKLTLEPSDAYKIGDSAVGKVKITYTP